MRVKGLAALFTRQPLARRGLRAVEETSRDLRFAVRLARRQWPAVTVAVAGLAVALGLATAVVSIVNGWQFRDNGVADPDGLFMLQRTQGARAGEGFQVIPALTYGEFVRLSGGVDAVALVARAQVLMQVDDLPERVVAHAVTTGYLRSMGATAHLGRADVGSTGPGSAEVLLSYGYWRGTFGGDRAIVGRTIRLNGRVAVVVGVVARAFTGPGSQGPALWLPIDFLADDAGTRPTADARSVNVVAYARVASSRSVEQAEAQLTSLGNGLWPGDAASGMPPLALVPTVERGRGNVRPDVAIALVVAGLVVVLACGNVTTLLLGIGAMRQREVAVRLALGASRRRLARQWLTESLTISLMGCAGGWILAHSIVPLVARQVGFAPYLDVWPDTRVLTIMALTSVVAGLVSGLSPARHGLRSDLHVALQGVTGRPIAGRGGTGTLVLQTALAVAVLSLTTLFARSALVASRLDFGIDTDRLITVQAFGPSLGQAGGTFWQGALRQVSGEAGVEAAALTARMPLSGSTRTVGYVGPQGVVPASFQETSSEYFQTAGLGILRGRGFTADDVAAGAAVAVVSARLATRLWGTAEPIGRELHQVGIGREVRTVVGVVEDSIPHYLRDYDLATVYVPLPAKTWPVALVVRARGAVESVRDRVRSTVQAIDRSAPVSTTLVGGEADRQRETLRRPLQLSLVTSSIALVLAMAGVYAVTNFTVRGRRREIGVRLSLGASRLQLWRDLLGPGIRALFIGCGVGLIGALVGGRAVRAALLGVQPFDPLALAFALLVVVTVAVLGAGVPLLRALRVDPAAELRQP